MNIKKEETVCAKLCSIIKHTFGFKSALSSTEQTSSSLFKNEVNDMGHLPYGSKVKDRLPNLPY